MTEFGPDQSQKESVDLSNEKFGKEDSSLRRFCKGVGVLALGLSPLGFGPGEVTASEPIADPPARVQRDTDIDADTMHHGTSQALSAYDFKVSTSRTDAGVEVIAAGNFPASNHKLTYKVDKDVTGTVTGITFSSQADGFGASVITPFSEKILVNGSVDETLAIHYNAPLRGPKAASANGSVEQSRERGSNLNAYNVTVSATPTTDGVRLTVEGAFPSSGHTLFYHAHKDNEGAITAVEIFSKPPEGPALTRITPFKETIEISGDFDRSVPVIYGTPVRG